METHNHKVQKLCLICLQPNKLLTLVTETQKITDLLPSFDTLFYPTKICSTCNYHFKKYVREENRNSKNVLIAKIERAGHAVIQQERFKRPRSGNDCTCFFCDLVKNSFKTPRLKLHNSKRNQSKKQHSDERLCAKCLTKVTYLNKHLCQRRTMIANLERILEENNLTDQVVHKVLRKKAKNSKSNKFLQLKTVKHTTVPILYNYKPRCISLPIVNSMMGYIIRSGNKLRQNLKLIRKALGRKSIQTNVEKDLRAEEEIIQDLIEFKVV